MSNLSLLILTKNEQENLKKWAEWLPKLTVINEIVAVDDNSTDDTKKILKSFESTNLKINIFDRGVNGNFASQRNFAITKAKNDWVLFIDADEIPSPKLINLLNSLKLNENYCYSIKRYLVYCNHILYHGISATDRPVRLFNKNLSKFIKPVHEVLVSKNKIININQPLFHYSAPNLKTFLSKLNHYSTIRAQELFNQKTKANLLDIIFYPKAKFIQYYIWHLGFLDGVAGLIICLSLAFYSFLVRSKLWRLYHA